MKFARPLDVYFTLVVAIVVATRPIPFVRGPLAEVLGRLAHQLPSAKRRRSRAALRRAFGGSLSPEAERRALRGAFVSFWREVLGWRPATEDVAVEGLEHLRAALARGRGAILWISRTFGLRGLSGEILHDHGFDLHVVHGPRHLEGFMTRHHDWSWVRRHVIRPFFDRRELRWAAEIMDLPGGRSLAFTRALEARLRANRVLRVAGDGPMGHRYLTLPFLGVYERFATGMVSLARATGAALLPMFCYVDESGRCRLVIEPPIEVARGDRETSQSQALTRYASLLEGYTRRHPDQFRSWHIVSSLWTE
ncbi:MAG: hypothetical protein ABR527_05705 [Gemmatimonadota bacterium]